MTRWYWVTCHRFTVLVGVQDGRVVWAAPIVAKFCGQPFDNLARWMRSLGGFAMQEIGS